MAIIITIIFFLLLFTVQTTLLQFADIGGMHPDLIIIAAIFIGYRFSKGKSLLLGGLLGMMQDILSGGIIGMNTLSKGLISFFAVHIKKIITLENVPAQLILIAGGTLLEGVLFQFLSSVLPMIQIPKGFWGNISILALYNALVGPLLLLLLNKNIGRISKT